MSQEPRPNFPLYEPRRGDPNVPGPSGGGFWIPIFILVICAIGLVSIVAIAAGFLTLGWQVLTYLQSGSWVPLTMIDVGLYVFDAPWLHRPTAWFGLHSILQMVPASAGLIVGGTIGMGISSSAMDAR